MAKKTEKKVEAKKAPAKKAEKAPAKAPAKKAEKKVVKRRTMSVMVSSSDIPAPAKKLIDQMDKLEAQIAEIEEKKQELFQQIIDALGATSFEHPENGPTTIMSRAERYFWRAKPLGKYGANGSKKAA